MAGRAIWKGIIHFRDVDIPVKLHTAVREERIKFHLLHKRDQARLKQQMVCAYEKTPVPPDEQTRGFEVEDGKYILIDQEELVEVEPESSRLIDIHEFVKADQIDPIFISRSYYLEPDLQSKNYMALLQVMKEQNLEGICTWSMRKHSYFGSMQAADKIFRLHTLRYADEIVSVSSLNLGQISLSEKELQIGSELINKMSEVYQPQKIENEHEKKLQDLIDQKARGEKIILLRPRKRKATEPDQLLKTLEASLKKIA
ncbi:MAG: Ku protein [Smithella sp.]